MPASLTCRLFGYDVLQNGANRAFIGSWFPPHITQRGNRRQETFFHDEDYQTYIDPMTEWRSRCGVEVWAWRLTQNRIHLTAAPESEDSLRPAIGEAHRRCARRINFREGWRGHRWPGRISSHVMDESCLFACVRYIETNPARAGLVTKPEKWSWSSASAHMSGNDGKLVKAFPLLRITGGSWEDFLNFTTREEEIILIQRHERTGRPLGSVSFVEGPEKTLGRLLQPKKAGRKTEGANT